MCWRRPQTTHSSWTMSQWMTVSHKSASSTELPPYPLGNKLPWYELLATNIPKLIWANRHQFSTAKFNEIVQNLRSKCRIWGQNSELRLCIDMKKVAWGLWGQITYYKIIICIDLFTYLNYNWNLDILCSQIRKKEIDWQQY